MVAVAKDDDKLIHLMTKDDMEKLEGSLAKSINAMFVMMSGLDQRMQDMQKDLRRFIEEKG